MSVYVDRLKRKPPTEAWRFPHTCRLMADRMEELLDFAEKELGLSTKWLRGPLPHFQINKSKREQALEAGAREITKDQLARLIRRFT
jgi:hypothetical protein